jgi:hypothetical protein
MRRTLLVALVSLSLLAPCARPCLARQTGAPTTAQAALALDQHARKMKRNVEKMGVGHQVTAVLKAGGEYHGTVSKVDDESFQVAEVDLKRVVTIKYDETKKLYGNYYFRKQPLVGRNPRGNKIVIVSILALVAVGFIAGLAHISE